MSASQPALVDYAARWWFHPKGLLAALLLALGVSAVLLPSQGLLIAVAVFGALAAVIAGAWLFTRRVPRVPKGKIGFAVAITCEDEAMRRRVLSDFVVTLRTLIKNSPSGKKFAFIAVREDIAARVVDAEDAAWLHTKSKCHFVVYGRVRERRIGDANRYLINLNGLVAHAPLRDDVQKSLAREFTELFPRQVGIKDDDGFLGFEFTTKWAHVVAKYVIGLAMALSNFFDDADPMLAEAGSLAAGIPGTFPAFARIRARVPEVRAAMQVAKARACYERWTATGMNDATYVERAAAHLAGAMKLDPNVGTKPLVIGIRCILAFLLGRNCSEARLLLDQIPKRARGSLWHYNKGFLYAYEGNLKKATQSYAQGAQLTIEPEKIAEVELFTEWVISQEPGRYELYFSLGLLNRNLKNDKRSAIRDFESFLEHVPSEKYLGEQRAARTWISRMRRDI